MKHGVIYFSSAIMAAFFALPLSARADARPDFDDDAKPILKMQPGLVKYVESRFEVKETGIAKYPGDDDHPPGPPYIFNARPIGSHGPYNVRLLIQPGSPGHVLAIVPPKTPANPSSQPAVANQPSPPTQPPPQTPAPPAPAPVQQPSAPTADTPSGPIMEPGSQPSASNSPQPSLAPPPDPAPPAQ